MHSIGSPHLYPIPPTTMGFSSEWTSIMKGIVKEAFTPDSKPPNMRGAFIDGQIQLMKPLFITTMDLFYRIQFANLINRYPIALKWPTPPFGVYIVPLLPPLVT